MTQRHFFKLSSRQIFFLIFALVLTLIASVIAVTRMDLPDSEALAFVSVGLNQENLTYQSSSEDLLRSSEHFADMILGYTVDPAFADEFEAIYGKNVSYSARRQEKENLLFFVAGPPGEIDDKDDARGFVNLIQARMDEYNSSTGASYVLALERYSFIQGERSDWRFVAGVLLLAGFGFISLTLLWNYVFESRCRS